MRYYILAGVLVILLGGYTAYWFTLATATEAGIEDWREAARGDGMVLRHRGVSVGGYPFRLEVTLEAPALTYAAPDGVTTLSAAETVAVAMPWRPNHILARSNGPLRIDWAPPGAAALVTATANEAEASLYLGDDGQPLRGALDLHAIAGDGPAGAFSAARAQLHLRRARQAGATADPAAGATAESPAPDDGVPASYDAALQVDLLQLPEGAAPPELGREIETLDLVATFRGEWPPGPPPEALAAWRAAGGVVDVTDLKLVWGPASLASEGSLTVDEEMRPLGAFTVRLGGYEALLDLIAQARRIDGTQIALLKLLLGSMAREDAQGRSTVQFPVSAQDGRLFFGPVGLFSLPPVL